MKVGMNLLGRPKIVQYLAKLLAKLIQRFVEPQAASALSQAIVDAGLRLIHLETTLSGRLQSHVTILHGGAMPRAAQGGVLSLLPQKMRQKLVSQLSAWLGQSLCQHLQQRAPDFIAATEAPADGVTVTVTFTNPPGFAALRRAMGGQPMSVKAMESLAGMPDVTMAIVARFNRG